MLPNATGAVLASANSNQAQGGGPFTLLLFALPILFIGYLFWSQRNRQRKVATMQSELQIGDEVMTSTGLYGTIVELSDQVVVLEAAPGVQLRWDRRAIVRSPLADRAADQGIDPQPETPEHEAPNHGGEPTDPNQPREGQ